MRTFVIVMLIVFVLDLVPRVYRIANGTATKPKSFGLVVADGMINGFLAIWASFLLWY